MMAILVLFGILTVLGECYFSVDDINRQIFFIF